MKKQTHIVIHCDDCDKDYKLKCESFSDIPRKCPKCGSDELWLREVIRDGKEMDDDIRLGNGGSFTANW